ELTRERRRPIPFPNPTGDYTAHMKVEEIAEAVAKLPPDQLARFRRWFTAFEASQPDHAQELDSAATKLGRFAGRAFAELKRRTKGGGVVAWVRCDFSRRGDKASKQ